MNREARIVRVDQQLSFWTTHATQPLAAFYKTCISQSLAQFTLTNVRQWMSD
jgi:hypothetical protein